jgi:hypothetical protein
LRYRVQERGAKVFELLPFADSAANTSRRQGFRISGFRPPQGFRGGDALPPSAPRLWLLVWAVRRYRLNDANLKICKKNGRFNYEKHMHWNRRAPSGYIRRP